MNWRDYPLLFVAFLFFPILAPVGFAILALNMILWYPTSSSIAAQEGRGYFLVQDWRGLIRQHARKPALFCTVLCALALVLSGFGTVAVAAGTIGFYAFYIYWNCVPAWQRLRYSIHPSGAPESEGISIVSQKWNADRVLHQFSRTDGLGGTISLGSMEEYETGFYVLECTPESLIINVQAAQSLRALGPDHVVDERMTILLCFPERGEPRIEPVADDTMYPDVAGRYMDGKSVRPKLLESNSRLIISCWNGFAFDGQAARDSSPTICNY